LKAEEDPTNSEISILKSRTGAATWKEALSVQEEAE